MKESTKQLRDYLGMVLDIERSLYMQLQLMRSLQSQETALAPLALPARPDTAPPTASKPQTRVSNPGLWLLAGMAAAAAAVWMYLRDETNTPQWVQDHPLVLVIPFLLAVVFALVTVKKGIGGLYHNANVERDNQRAQQEDARRRAAYQSDTRSWQDAVLRTGAENLRRERERAVVAANYKAVRQQSDASRDNLARLYAAGNVHPKYRNLAAVSALYEYVDTGICETLEGPFGAYSRLEQDARMDRILLKLDHVIDRLDELRSSQYQLYRAVTEDNERSEMLLASVAQDVRRASDAGQESARRLAGIEANDQIIAYNTERTRKELEYFNRMRTRLGDYDRVWDAERP